jgi:leader peptidase (prepilin peptidase)/N-methyltransferase
MESALASEFIIVTYMALLGLIVGSFLNVCIHRLPRGESIAWPSSHCPQCNYKIKFYENIPLVSYLFLRGKCSNCNVGIPLRYPLVEAAGALLLIAVYFHAGLGTQFLEETVFLVILLGIAITDAEHYTIPDLFSVGGALAGIFFSFLGGGLTPLESLVGLIVGGGALYLIAIIGEMAFGKEAMGGGDIKMMAMVGAFTGWPGVIFTVFVGSLTGSVVFGYINFVMKKHTLVPFGIFLSIGAAAYVFAGQDIIDWYLGFFNIAG